MKYQTDDLRITGMQEVIAPEDLIAQLPLSETTTQRVFSNRQTIRQIINGADQRLLVVIGPCSIHDPTAALEYAERLQGVAKNLHSQLHIIMRVYFEKPRTIAGWKGLINDPNLDNSYNINQGLQIARGLLNDIVELGLGTGTEYLDPITPQYLGDLVSWGAIGARTTESQIHRQLASGLSCPVGFKNSTDGSVQIAVDAIRSAAHSHIFLSVTKQGRSAIFSTAGNEDCHVILRGGGGQTNFDGHNVKRTADLLYSANATARIMIDMSHANSEKDHNKQLTVSENICHQLEQGESHILGVMIESNLVAGRQEVANRDALTYGQSITDACIDWDDSERLLTNLAEANAKRRQS